MWQSPEDHQVVSHHTTNGTLDDGGKVLESSVDGPVSVVVKEGEVETFKQQCPLYPKPT